jgi:hypothetical protein
LLKKSYNNSQENHNQFLNSQGGSRWFGKKIYAIIALIAVVIVAIALFIPQGAAAIPLNVDYTVGEKMAYETTITATYETQNTQPTANMQPITNATVYSTETIDVIDFDGEYYTLNHTHTFTLKDTPFSYSMTEKMNKTGYSTYILNLGSASQEVPNTSMTSASYLTQLLSKPEVKVGDTITIPYPNLVASMGMTGKLTMTFAGIEDLTVPTGTYHVFRIDITSNDLKLSYKPSTGIPSLDVQTNMDINVTYQIFMEYGTMRQIKSSMQETISYQSETIEYTMHLTTDTTLREHTTP